MSVDHAFDKGLKGGIVFHQGQVGPYLCGAIAQPHGIDVAGDNIGIGLTIDGFVIHGGIEGVGEAVFE